MNDRGKELTIPDKIKYILMENIQKILTNLETIVNRLTKNGDKLLTNSK